MKSPTKNLEDRVACMANEGRDAKWKSGNNVCTLSLADSGASSTMRKTTAHMTDVQTTAIKVQTATQGKTMNAVGQGTLHVNLKLADGKCTEMQIPGVLVIPDLAYELTSIQSITEGGHTVVFSKGVSGIYLSQNKRTKMSLFHLCRKERCGTCLTIQQKHRKWREQLKVFKKSHLQSCGTCVLDT